MPERTYSQDDVAAIIERVAERQRQSPASTGAAGLTIEEIERACDAAGLDPALVREAAAELDAGGLALESRSPTTSIAEHWADGPATAEGWEDAVDQLRVRFGVPAGVGTGEGVRPVGGGWEWTHLAATGLRRTVSVSPRGGRTRIRVVTVDWGFADPRVTGSALGALLGLLPAALVGALVAEGLGFGDFAGAAAMALALLAAVAVGAAILPPRVRRNRETQARDARALAEEVAGWVAGAGAAVEARLAPEAAERPAPEPTPDLSLDLDEPPPDTDPLVRGSRRSRA